MTIEALFQHVLPLSYPTPDLCLGRPEVGLWAGKDTQKKKLC